MNEKIQIKIAIKENISEISSLFYNTIQNINIKDYSREKVDCWTAKAFDKEKWSDKIKNQYFLLAMLDEKVVGFSSLEKDGYLDYLFVHKDYQRQGIASKLMTSILDKANEQKNIFIYSDVSITAKDFFLNNGFLVEKEQRKNLENLYLTNYKMIKDLKK